MIQLPLPAFISTGQMRMASVAKALADNPISDIVAEGKNIYFSTTEDNQTQMHVVGNHTPQRIHRHALGQICTRMRFPRAYVYNLLNEKEEWAADLLVENLNTLFPKRGDGRKFLIRSVHEEARGFLSNAYKCLDSETLINSFANYARAVKAEPYDAFSTDLRVVVQAALPDVWKMGDCNLKVGVMFRNSEFGAGLAQVNFFISSFGRSMIGQRGVKKSHRGRRLTVDQAANERLKETDSQKVAAEMESHIFAHLEHSNIQAVMAEVELSTATTVDVDKVSDVLATLELNEEELKAAVQGFEVRDDLGTKGYTMFRLANTLAWLAAEASDPERKLELMGFAGSLIMKE